MSLLTARQLTLASEARRRARRPLLTGLDLHVDPGQCWLLRGAHGSGKSRLLAVLAGVAQPLTGAVQVLGEPVGSRRAAQAVGWAPEDLSWPSPQRVQDALAEVAAMQTPAALTDRVLRALQLTGLEHVARQRASRLSAGQRRLLSLAQALLDDPPLLLIDGQLDTLDEHTAPRLLDELAARRAEGAGMIVATHAPERLAGLATHELLLADGVAQARALDVSEAPPERAS